MTAVDHAELKPCPFCGSAAKLEAYGDRRAISCTECSCRTPLGQRGEDPVLLWNLRTPDAALLSEIEGLKAEREKMVEGLKDPQTVHINMLRGGIAKPTACNIGHLYRGEDAVAVVDEVMRQNPDAFALRTQAPDSWRPMSEAPTDRIIIAMCRYPTATDGSPSFIGWDGKDGWIYSRNKPERVVCWAWKPREILGDWPQETALRPQTAESGE